MEGFFQYPLSDRAGCNQMRKRATLMTAFAFSILSRIERAVTVVEQRKGKEEASFSILSRIERAVTAVSSSDALSESALSVSSLGSSGL